MNNKNRRIKRLCLVIVLVYCVTAIVYIDSAYIPLDLNALLQPTEPKVVEKPVIKAVISETKQPSKPPLIKSCSATNSCTVKAEVVTAPATVTKPDANIQVTSANIPSLQKDMHQCRLEVDHQSVQQVKHIIEQIKYDTALTKNTYQVTKYLSLSITSLPLAEVFAQTLLEKLTILLEKYEYSFGLYLAQETEIKLIILPSKESYLSFISELSINSPNSQGVFWTRSNYAFIAYKSDEQVMQTTFHEAIHALNFSLIGLQPRWINEGLAELFESMQLKDDNGTVVPTFATPTSNNALPPLDYLDLISSEQQWDSEDRAYLYTSSRDFLHYLLAHQEGNLIVSNLLREERQDPCTTLSEDRYIQIIEDNIFYLEYNFEEWLLEIQQ